MRRPTLWLSAICLLLLVSRADAVIVAGTGGTGSQNTTSTGAGTGWNYTGTVNGSSGVYLGQYGGGYWVLTADHVSAGSFTLGGYTYDAVANSAANPVAGADLEVFRITSANPAAMTALSSLSNLSLASSDSSIGTSVTMIGNGRGGRSTDTVLWTSGWQETEFQLLAAYEGYTYGSSGQVLRWGTNHVGGNPYVNSGTEIFLTDFDETAGEAQGSAGDSGGGVFNSSGTLVGLMIVIGGYNGQPANTAVFGNITGSANIAQYSTAILTAIPEPSVSMLVLGAIPFAWWALRRRMA